jgi:hypothetical protein
MPRGKRTLLDEMWQAVSTQKPGTGTGTHKASDRQQLAGAVREDPGGDLPAGVIRLDNHTYRAMIGGRTLVFERAQVVVRISGRWQRHLSRYLVGWTSGVLHELFLGIVETAGEWLHTLEKLHRRLDALVPKLGLAMLGEALKVMEFRAARG